MISDFLAARLNDHETLTFDKERTDLERQEAAAAVQPVMTSYLSGEDTLAEAGNLLSDKELDLLRHEWRSMIENMHWVDKLARVAAYAGMLAALYLLCGSYIFFVDDRDLLFDRIRLAKLLTVIVIADQPWPTRRQPINGAASWSRWFWHRSSVQSSMAANLACY